MANRDYVDCSDRSFDIALLEAEFRKDKAKGMSNFTRSLNNLLLIVDSKNLPSRSEVCDACHSMDLCMEIVMELLSNFTSFYIKNKELQKAYVVVSEMEKLETNFSGAYKITWANLGSLECNLLIDPERPSIINEDAEMDTYRKKLEIPSNQTLDKTRNSLKTQNNSGKTLGERSADPVTANNCPEAGLYKLQNSVNTDKPDRNTETFVRTEGFVTPNIGYDMWTQINLCRSLHFLVTKGLILAGRPHLWLVSIVHQLRQSIKCYSCDSRNR